ncbi:MAG TPA: hypothetical protein VF061_02950, partial [Gemmatimonadales bacterium]
MDRPWWELYGYSSQEEWWEDELRKAEAERRRSGRRRVPRGRVPAGEAPERPAGRHRRPCQVNVKLTEGDFVAL